jgi:hypothetical protein
MIPWDFSSRRMAVLLTVYVTQPLNPVCGLAIRLNISKPVSPNRLGEFGLVCRKLDETDRHSFGVQRMVQD